MSAASTNIKRAGALALAALAGTLLAGCASAFLIPPGSRPLATAPVAVAEWSRLLPGTWDVRATLQPQASTYAGNLVRRAADVAGVAGWRQWAFAPPRAGGATLTLSGEGRSSQLDYRIEGDLIAIGPGDPRLSHEHWQANYAGGLLYLRSITDGEVLVLAKRSG